MTKSNANKKADDLDRSRGRRLPWLSWTTAVLMLVSAAFGAAGAMVVNLPVIMRAVSSEPVVPSVKFTTPSTLDVPAEGLVPRGTSTGLHPNDVLWLATQKIGDNSFQPQVFPCTVAANSDWTCPATYVGNADADRGQTFDIVLYRVDGHAVSTFLAYDRGKAPGAYPGMTQMPDGAQELGRVEVVRK